MELTRSPLYSLRKANTFIASIFIMAILFTFGTIYLVFGVNTKNLVRAAYIDQIASFLSEAAARETEVLIRKDIGAQGISNSLWNKVTRKKKGVGASFDTGSLSATASLISESNINFIGAGRFSLITNAEFGGIDRSTTKKTGGRHGSEKTGNVRISVNTEYKFKSTKKKSFRWHLINAMDFRVVNALSECPPKKVPGYNNNPTSDYVLWVKGAGMQNALTDGQVMHPYKPVSIDAVKPGVVKLMMGSGYNWEDFNASIVSKRYQALDIAPLYINIDASKMPPVNPAKLSSLNRRVMTASYYFSKEKSDYINFYIRKIKPKIASARKKAKAKVQEAKAKGLKAIDEKEKETLSKAKADYDAKANSTVPPQNQVGGKTWSEWRSIIKAEFQKKRDELIRDCNNMNKKMQKEINDGEKRSYEMIKTAYNHLYTTTINLHRMHTPILTGNPKSGGRESWEALINEAHKFAKAELSKLSGVGGKRAANWAKRWTGANDEWKKECSYWFQKLESLRGHNKGIVGNAAFHRRLPLTFKNLLDGTLQGNFKKRFFTASVFIWDTNRMIGYTVAKPSGSYPDAKILGKVKHKGGSLFNQIVGEVHTGVNRQIPVWLKNRPDAPGILAHPLEKAPYYYSPPKGVHPQVTWLWRDLIVDNKRSYPPRKARTISATNYNTDFRYFTPVNGGPDGGFKGTRIKGFSRAGNYNAFNPWSIPGKIGARLKRFRSYYFKDEKLFKSTEFYDDKNGAIYLKGLMWVDKGFKFTKSTTFYGRGIFMVTGGNIEINGGLKVGKPGRDYCVLFAKGVKGFVPDIVIKKGKISNISLMALNQSYRDRKISTCSTIRTTGCDLVLYGNYVADAVGWAGGLANGRFKTKKTFKASIKYDPSFYKSNGVYCASMGGRYNEWRFRRVLR
ncbi:hypothetical protein ACFL35_05515 [Candidatus Riflebacteria bacterium]